MEKRFREMQGRHSSSGARRREMAVLGDGLGRDVMGMGRLGSGARSWDLRDFPLVMFS